MFTIAFFLALAALIVTILAAIGRAPLWVAVVLLSILVLLEHVPLK